MFDKDYWRKQEEEVMERQNKEMANIYKEWNNSEVTLTPRDMAICGVWEIPKKIQKMAEELTPLFNYDELILIELMTERRIRASENDVKYEKCSNNEIKILKHMLEAVKNELSKSK